MKRILTALACAGIAAFSTQAAAQSASVGTDATPVFSTKAQLLDKTRNGLFLDLDKYNGDKSAAFSASVQTVLRNDYGVAALPNDVGCKGEFEANVNSLLGQMVRAHMSTLDDRPPQFTNPNRNIQTERKSIEEAVARLPSQRDGWCSAKGVAHPYLTALPKLLSEFDAATAQAVNERRSQWQVQYQRKEADEAARKRAADEAQWTQKASTENARREKEQAAKSQREAQERGAAARNQSQIKALGLPSNFVASMLYVNFMGQWSPLMPCNQWLGLLLENKKIASVEAISVRGYPGVSIKRTGQPAVGIVFRMEGKEAYVFAMVIDGRLEQIRSPADHSQVSLTLKVLTIE